jgi:hypothetical protein
VGKLVSSIESINMQQSPCGIEIIEAKVLIGFPTA